MNFCFNLWDNSEENCHQDYEELLADIGAPLVPALDITSLLFPHDDPRSIHALPLELVSPRSPLRDPQRSPSPPPRKRSPPLNNTLNLSKPNAQKSRRKRKIKPSPYHNFQKHLNIAVKGMVSPSQAELEAEPSVRALALDLWNIFYGSDNSTKKILHFVFNEFNEHHIQNEELRELGFEEIYRRSSREQLRLAKNYLTRVGLLQLSDALIDCYLETRRIKNPLKFKRYIQLFRQQLEDGFLKKRFTNRSRKLQIQQQMQQMDY